MTAHHWRSSAPANLMLMGEHSVVFGHPALACALQQRLSIEWRIRQDSQIIIHSALGTHQTDLKTLAQHPKLTWVMACLQDYQAHLKHGLEIRITAEFESTWGLGSSAALLAAMLGGLDAICGLTPSFQQRFARGLAIIHQLQGRGSGTDLAASLMGGVIIFNPLTQAAESVDLPNTQLPLQLWYCGYKTPTAEVLRQVAQHWHSQSALQTQLYALMGQNTQAAYQALQSQQWGDFYLLINSYQGLMDALGVNDGVLSQLVYGLRHSLPASKISGSGLGDCVLGFGPAQHPLPTTLHTFQQIDCHIDSRGLLVELITDI